MSSADRWEQLKTLLRSLPPMTPEQQELQRMSFVYGNLACTTNHKPTRLAFWKLAESKGWTKERFDAWANDKEWWDGDR